MSTSKSKSTSNDNINKIVLPGDIINIDNNLEKIKIGSGLMQTLYNDIRSTKCGILNNLNNNTYYVKNIQKWYIPSLDDNIIGIITEKMGEFYKVDIGATHPAILNILEFEGATKRNRPYLQIGSIVYARVIVANKDIAPEISCISPKYKKDWVTGESVFSELKDGYYFEIPLNLSLKLLSDDCLVLKLLGQTVSFELAIGQNGRVWIKSNNAKTSIIVSNAIKNSYRMDNNQIKAMVQQLINLL